MKILVAEDEENNIALLVRRLKRKGYEVVVARNGQEALDLVRHENPDVVLMDMRMPVMDGYEATRALKGDGATARIPVIGVSAHAGEEDRQKALMAGCDGYVTKPIDFSELLVAIDVCLKSA